MGLYYWLGFGNGKRNLEKLAESSRQKAVSGKQLGKEIFIPDLPDGKAGGNVD
ncbi:MAG: hypothetical protein Q8K40_05490 [Ignavibacteria bacterium]|nr:hypothetical protein [Ignavibacteria bacterium]